MSHSIPPKPDFSCQTNEENKILYPIFLENVLYHLHETQSQGGAFLENKFASPPYVLRYWALLQRMHDTPFLQLDHR
jgi:hypothetical protein